MVFLGVQNDSVVQESSRGVVDGSNVVRGVRWTSECSEPFRGASSRGVPEFSGLLRGVQQCHVMLR